MNKPLKIILTIVGVVCVLGILAIVGLGYSISQVMNGVRITAEDVYGGPMPSTVYPVMAFDLTFEKSVFMVDFRHNVMYEMTQTPFKYVPHHHGFSESNVKDVLMLHAKSHTDSLYNSLIDGKEKTIKLAKQSIHVLEGKDSDGGLNEMVVLNLDKGQTVIIGESLDSTDTNTLNTFNQFITLMPSVTNPNRLSEAKIN